MNQRYTVAKFVGFLGGCCLALAATAQTTQLDPTFQVPQIRSGTSTGAVYDVVQQADGKYIIGGSFSSINGVRARNLARLNADGTLDAAFTANCPANRPVSSVAIQPNGSILVGGSFDSLGAAAQRSVGRLLPSGVLDAAFAANFSANTLAVSQVASLPGGDALVLVPTGPSFTTQPSGLYRLNGQTGQIDPGFQQAVAALCFAVQPDGRILTGGGGGSYILMHLLARLLPNGSLDPGFQPATTYYTAATSQVELAANGDVYRNTKDNGAGLFGPAGYLSGAVEHFAIQPNGRILVVRNATAGAPTTSRLLPSGQVDASYLAASGPRADANGAAQIKRIRVQPNGAIMMAGAFTLVGTTPVYGLVRMLDSSVLAAKNEQAEIGTTVWPVPVANVLNVKLEAAAHPQQVQLLDALGRVVLGQAIAAGTAALALDVAALPAGVYTLRVSYTAAAPVVRHLVVQR